MRMARFPAGLLLAGLVVTLAACSSSPASNAPKSTATSVATTTATVAPAPTTTSTPAATTTIPLAAFVGSWSTHDGSIVISGNGSGQLDWPGATPPEGVPQVAQISVTATSPSQATVTVTSGRLIFVSDADAQHTYGPGSTFMLSIMPFGMELTEGGQHLYDFCTASERAAGQDQQYCGA
jgi:hypothetical protein